MVAKADVRKFFKVYEKIYNDAIADTVDLNDVADMYSAGFVSVTPAAVMVGENGEQLKAIMTKGFEAYRALGSKRMTSKEVSVTPVDQDHCVAEVNWAGDYEARMGVP